VTVTCLVPGFTKTNFAAVAGMKGGEATPFPEMTAETVARAGLEAVRRRKAVVVVHPLDRLWIMAGKLVPRWVPAKLGARFFVKTRLDS
jgi:short-subunit dehydrogenase